MADLTVGDVLHILGDCPRVGECRAGVDQQCSGPAMNQAHGDVQKWQMTAEHADRKPLPEEDHCPSVSTCATRYCSSTCGVGSALYDAVAPNAHGGGESCCDSVHAACLAAPSATYSAGVGTCTGAARTVGAMRRTASKRAPPPIRLMRCTSTPCAEILSTQYAIEASSPSTAARATLAGTRFRVVTPCNAPAASGRLGERSPSKYGTRVRPSAPGGDDNASRSISSKSTPSIVATAASTGAPLSVHTSGSWRPVASAKPATIPSGSCGAASPTALTTPDVPSETTQSPGPAPRPSAAAALSPAPGPSTAPAEVCPAGSLGPSTVGSAGRRPRSASSSRSIW